MWRIGWLRAAVLGANDGIISVSSLIVGVASSSTGRSGVLLSGSAALVAGDVNGGGRICLGELAGGCRSR